MKKFIAIFLCLYGTYSFAQTSQKQTHSGPSLRLNGYATYAFADNNVDSYYSTTSYFDGKIEGGFQYGGGLEILPYPMLGAEFLYLRLDSKAPMSYYGLNGATHSTFNVAQNWVLFSANKYLQVNPKVEPYGGFQIGMDIVNVDNPDNGNSTSATKLAWGLKAGLNLWLNEKVGLKMQASLLSAVQAVGGGVYFGTGGGGAAVSGFSTYYQFNLGGGLVFKLR